MKQPVVVFILFLYGSAVFGADDVTDTPISTAPTDGSNDDSIVTEENTIVSEVQNSDTSNSATEDSPDSNDAISDAVTEVTEDASKNDPEETESSTNQSNEVDAATTVSSTNQRDEGNGNSSSTANNEDSSTNASTEPQMPMTTTEPAFSCGQSGVGRFARPGNCHDYYYCWDSVHEYVIFSCKSKVFDPIIKQCVNNWAHCESTPKCSEDRQVLADPDDVNAFFVCKSPPGPLNPGFLVQKEKCHGEREFDTELGYCKTVATEPTSSAESAESNEKFECNAVGIYADIHDETKYFECKLKSVSKGKLKLCHHSCPKYHVFSLEDMLCIPVQ